jgi:hypothetical protein
MNRRELALAALVAGLVTVSALAHHTYSVFDMTQHLTVSGVVARLEWKNPHAYIWVYVPSAANPGKYDLWAFENGAPTTLTKMGWSRGIFEQNERVTVEYSPLRDGRPGGHCVNVKRANGSTLGCSIPPTAAGSRR